jgi:peptide/nickel transport system substrate-binding protein
VVIRTRMVSVIAATAVLLAVTASATSASVDRAGAAKASSTVTIAIGTDPGNLDPQLTLVGEARQVDSFAYDTIVNVVGPGKVVSGLARSWKVLSPKKVVFTLRAGLTCSDGSKLTASVVKQNFDFVGNPANKSPLLGTFMPVGAKTAANNAARTVTVTTTIPNPFMLQGLGFVQIVCAKGLANRGVLAKGAVGSGPYKLVGAVPGDHYTFQLRKGYAWGPNGATSASLPAKVVLKVVTNESTTANLLLTGGVNAGTLLGPDRKRLDGKKVFHRNTVATPVEIFFNQAQGHPGSSLAVRKGLVQSLNLSQIGTVATGGLGEPMTQLTRQDLTPCAGNSVKGNVPAYNVGAAKSAFGGSPPSVTLLYPTDQGSTFAPTAELMQAQLQQAGVKVTLDAEPTAALTGKIFGTGDWDIVLIGLGVSTPAQLTSILAGPAPPNGTNFAHLSNADYAAAIARASRRVGAAGCKYWLDGEGALFRDADLAPTSVLTSATYGKGLTFALGPAGILPTSLRIVK